jgi:hypothetical protein
MGMSTSESAGTRPALTVRLIHGAYVAGIVLFAVVTHFLIRPQRVGESVTPSLVLTLLGVALAAVALSVFVLRGRVPKKNSDESADLYWTRASAPALITWAPLEGASLLAIVAYMLSGSTASLGVGAVALLLLAALHPGHFERA